MMAEFILENTDGMMRDRIVRDRIVRGGEESEEEVLLPETVRDGDGERIGAGDGLARRERVAKEVDTEG
jgi:hypothetical protein